MKINQLRREDYVVFNALPGAELYLVRRVIGHRVELIKTNCAKARGIGFYDVGLIEHASIEQLQEQ